MNLVTKNVVCVTDPYYACARKVSLDIAYSIPGYAALNYKEKQPIYDAIHQAVLTMDANTLADIINKDLPWWEQVTPEDIAAVLPVLPH